MTDKHGTPGLSQRSGMISLDLPDGAVPMHPGGVDDHHVTLAYLGPDVDDKALMVAVAATRRAAGEHGPLMLGVGGLGMFPPSDGSDGKTPAYVPVIKTAGLAALRNSVGHLDASGRPDWTPHITLAYLDDPAAAPAPVSAREIPMRTITVHRGEDSWSFPLRGSGAPGPAATKVFVDGILRPMELGKVGPKGYIHGWIFVGAPGVGDEVYHPHHGRGTITAHDGTSVTVAFDKGATHRFAAKPSEGAEHHFEPRSGNAVEHGHLADRVARDPKVITALKDDELKGVDKELTDRAAALGRPGQVGKTHQKVKDEIARRGATSAGQRAKESVDAERNAEYLKAKEHASTLSTAAKTEKEHAEAAKAHRRAGNLLVDRVASRQVIDQRGRDYHEAQYAKHAQAGKDIRAEHEANRQHVASRMANAEILVGQREGLARQTGKKKDIEHAIAGHEEIARNARGAGMDEIADRHTAAAANLRAELTRQTTAGSAMAARDKAMQRRKDHDIDHAQRALDAMDKRPDAGGGSEQRAALREAANASVATGGRGGTAKAHEAAATAYRRYADLAEQSGDKKSADVARDHLATFHDEMAAHIQARRAVGAALRGEFTGGGRRHTAV